MSQHSKLMTTSEAAEMLRLHPDTLRHWRSTGSVDLPFVLVGGSVRYSESEVLDYLKQKRGEE